MTQDIVYQTFGFIFFMSMLCVSIANEQAVFCRKNINMDSVSFLYKTQQMTVHLVSLMILYNPAIISYIHMLNLIKDYALQESLISPS